MDKKQVMRLRKPSKKAENRLIRIRNKFIAKKTSFNAFCVEKGISQSYARKAVLDLVKSEEAQRVKSLIINAAFEKTAKQTPLSSCVVSKPAADAQ